MVTQVVIRVAGSRNRRQATGRKKAQDSLRNRRWPKVIKGLGAVLHAGLGVFLEKVADVDCETLEFFIEGLSRTKA